MRTSMPALLSYACVTAAPRAVDDLFATFVGRGPELQGPFY
ncbi:MAG TPA: hypothetical protein VMN60_05195 [Longimicrobiales bacterium]|nr:hypothetical protein [Longimicrobiales bacterium]